MSAKLPSRARELRKRLSKLDQMGGNVAETHELEQLRVELSQRAAPLKKQRKRARVLSQSGLPFLEPESLTAFRKKVSTVLERFSEAPEASTLKKGRTWRIMLGQLDDASRDVETAVVKTWRDYHQTLFAGETPQEVKAKLAKTEANSQALQVYRELYNRFKSTLCGNPK